nr:WAS/WASL-interacting protein family member 1-like [Penaeus vannamei]
MRPLQAEVPGPQPKEYGPPAACVSEPASPAHENGHPQAARSRLPPPRKTQEHDKDTKRMTNIIVHSMIDQWVVIKHSVRNNYNGHSSNDWSPPKKSARQDPRPLQTPPPPQSQLEPSAVRPKPNTAKEDLRWKLLHIVTPKRSLLEKEQTTGVTIKENISPQPPLGGKQLQQQVQGLTAQPAAPPPPAAPTRSSNNYAERAKSTQIDGRRLQPRSSQEIREKETEKTKAV